VLLDLVKHLSPYLLPLQPTHQRPTF